MGLGFQTDAENVHRRVATVILMFAFHLDDSLATLTECTTEQGRQTSDRETYAHSVISVIPSQEIQKMIEEVEALDEETLKVKKKIKSKT